MNIVHITDATRIMTHMLGLLLKALRFRQAEADPL